MLEITYLLINLGNFVKTFVNTLWKNFLLYLYTHRAKNIGIRGKIKNLNQKNFIAVVKGIFNHSS